MGFLKALQDTIGKKNTKRAASGLEGFGAGLQGKKAPSDSGFKKAIKDKKKKKKKKTLISYSSVGDVTEEER